MPMPSAIIPARAVAQSGVSITSASRPISAVPIAEPEQRDQDRQPGGDDRAEGDEQDEDRGDDADRFGRHTGGLGLDDRLAADLDLQPGALRAVDRGEDPLGVGDVHDVRQRRRRAAPCRGRSGRRPRCRRGRRTGSPRRPRAGAWRPASSACSTSAARPGRRGRRRRGRRRRGTARPASGSARRGAAAPGRSPSRARRSRRSTRPRRCPTARRPRRRRAPSRPATYRRRR